MKAASDKFFQQWFCLPQVDAALGTQTYFDVAITWQGRRDKGSEPLAGLLNLRHLEDSFGKGGYQQSAYHRVNTSLHHGSMAAEMKKHHEAHSEVVFQNSYCQIWEIVRPDSNKVTWFSLASACGFDAQYRKDYETATRLLESAKEKKGVSYGVRKEFRITAKALELLREDGDAKKRLARQVSTAESKARVLVFTRCRLSPTA